MPKIFSSGKMKFILETAAENCGTWGNLTTIGVITNCTNLRIWERANFTNDIHPFVFFVIRKFVLIRNSFPPIYFRIFIYALRKTVERINPAPR
jgi:hypothetical protein